MRAAHDAVKLGFQQVMTDHHDALALLAAAPFLVLALCVGAMIVQSGRR